MDWQFWRLVTMAQGISALLMALFFFAVAQSSRSRAMRFWEYAWFANLFALLVVAVYWGADASLVTLIGTTGYVFFKSSFVVLQVVGVVALCKPQRLIALRRLVGPLVGLALIGAVFTLKAVYMAALLQGVVIACGFVWGALYLFRHPLPRGSWLAVALLSRGVMAALELFGNFAVWQELEIVEKWGIGEWLSISSSLDAATEWAIGMASLLVLHELTTRELMQANAQLRQAQGHLQHLANHDQLTGLLNRHSLGRILDEARIYGAALAFFDIDDFKLLNDRYGHDMGDACLKRFSAALKGGFQGGEFIIRYAGDEFLVVALRQSSEQVLQRVETIRQKLEQSQTDELPILFSCGAVDIAPQSDPEDALRQADQAMYANKSERRKARQLAEP